MILASLPRGGEFLRNKIQIRHRRRERKLQHRDAVDFPICATQISLFFAGQIKILTCCSRSIPRAARSITHLHVAPSIPLVTNLHVSSHCSVHFLGKSQKLMKLRRSWSNNLKLWSASYNNFCKFFCIRFEYFERDFTDLNDYTDIKRMKQVSQNSRTKFTCTAFKKWETIEVKRDDHQHERLVYQLSFTYVQL